MDPSLFLYDIFKASLGGEVYEKQLMAQVDEMKFRDYEYTGQGVFAYFDVNTSIGIHQLPSESLAKNTNGKQLDMISNIRLVNEEMNIDAEVTIHLTDGIIDCLEIWNTKGDYPEYELKNYRVALKESDFIYN